MFNICCDEKIPYGLDAFSHYGKITFCKGNRLTSNDLKEVDVLLIRSGTRVDKNLLEGTPVRFVASATAGTDHVDLDYLSESGIPFYHAPGCNAESVVEYVLASLLVLASRKNVKIENCTLGIVGMGNVGRRLAPRAEALGLQVIASDPPLQESSPGHELIYPFMSLESLLEKADIITLHVPLTSKGAHPTYHMINESRLKKMKRGGWLINASRGGVVSNQDLKSFLKDSHLGAVVLDVWEPEPAFDAELLEAVDLGTPHIAGYSYEGRVVGTVMIYRAFVKHFRLSERWDPGLVLGPGPGDHLDLTWPSSATNLQEIAYSLLLQMYDVEADDRRFRNALLSAGQSHADTFLQLRKEYSRRRSFSMHQLHTERAPKSDVLHLLENGLQVQTSVG